jgi:ferric-dicitrate binding protein FerR (iron transport regulator)
MNQERFWELVSLKLSDEAGPQELAELETLLQESPDLGLRMETLEAIWDTGHKNPYYAANDSFNRHMQRLSNHLSEPVLQYEKEDQPEEYDRIELKRPSPYKKLWWTIGVAASIAFAVLVFGPFYKAKDTKKQNAQNTVSTKRGSKSKVQLPDGTEVWLNADSRITYNEEFQGNLREVSLEGEAFFDVAHDAARPFLIHTATIDLKVLGTAFNVRSYPDEKNTEASLIRGSIEVTLVKSPDQKRIILKPNDKLIVNNSEVLLTNEKQPSHEPVMTLAKINYKKQDNSAVEIFWVKDKLAFDNEELQNIALKIERWFDVKVSIKDEKLKQVHYTVFFEGETLRETMEALQEASGGDFKYTIEGKQVVIAQ